MNTSLFLFLRRLYRTSKLAALGLGLCAVWVVVALAAPWIATHDPFEQSLTERYQPPSKDHWFGTDRLGRDIFSRVVYGSRSSLMAGILVVGLALVIGGAIGAVAGFKGGRVDEVLMRLAEMVMGFPSLILAMAIAAMLGPSLQNAVIAIVAAWWPRYARVTRSAVLAEREKEYVLASISVGASPSRVLVRSILPNALPTVLVLATLDIGFAILTFSGLSYLGLGEAPPAPEWGALVAEGINAFHYWWLSAFPGAAIFSVALAFNFLGDGLRDLLDPQARALGR